MTIVTPAGIDPDRLRIALNVIKEAGSLPSSHPDAVALHRAVSKLFKDVKRSRRQAAKRARQEADKRVLEATATANPRRIDDETAGLLIAPLGQEPVALEAGAVATPHGFAGALRRS